MKLLGKGAYVHRYEKYDIGRPDFDAATDDLMRIIDAYDERFGYDVAPPEDEGVLVTT